MDGDDVWPVDPDSVHVAPDPDHAWKVLREGEPTAESRHEDRADALDAARALARDDEVEDPRIKVHNPDGSLDRVLRLDRL
jgi:hypothetical protein